MGSNYAARRPTGLRKLILSNSPATMKSWIDSYCSYRERLPKDVRAILMRENVEGDEYGDALMQMFSLHMCTVIPFPDEFAACFREAGDDPMVSSTM
jgi:L-proline amide hydrolase